MFNRLSTWILSWDDRIHPIVVRDLRRLRRHWVIEILTLLILTVMVVLFWIGSNIVGSISNTGERVATLTMIACVPSWGTAGLLMLFTALYPFSGLLREGGTDPLLQLVPLSPERRIRGYLLISLILSGYFALLSLPFVAAVQMISPAPLWTLLLPPAFFLCNISLFLFCLPFAVRATKGWELVVILLGMSYIGMYPIYIPWLGLGIFVVGSPLNPTALIVLLAVTIPLMLAIWGAAAYRLAVFFYRKRYSVRGTALLTLLGYVGLNVAFAIVFASLFLLTTFFFPG